MGFNVGNVGKSGSGKVRAAVVDSKTQATISKRLQVIAIVVMSDMERKKDLNVVTYI